MVDFSSLGDLFFLGRIVGGGRERGKSAGGGGSERFRVCRGRHLERVHLGTMQG